MRGGSRLIGVVLAVGLATATACTIPVFRFALDRWPPDTYRLEVTPVDAASPDVAKFLRNFGATSPINLKVSRLPAEASVSKLFAPNATTPLWEGKLDATSLASLTESPGRAELVRRILAGEALVWVLAESGDAAADAQVTAPVEKRLRYLEQVAQLPAIDPTDPDSQLGPGPALAVRFSLLRLPVEEVILRRMLAGTESGLAETKEPWLAAVFGRGRVLGAWPAAEIADEQIEQGCLFLLGACSCQVKSLNPGWDLLIETDWEADLQALGETKVPAEPVLPEVVVISGGAESPPSSGPNLPLWIAAITGFLILAAGVIWRHRVDHP